MSSGIKQLVQYAPETTVNTTPSPFARTTLPFTTASLDAAATTTESNTIKDNRVAAGTYVTGIDYTGDIEAELQYGTYDPFFEAAAYNNFQNNVLTFGGTIRKTFSILRGFSDVNDYHIFKGCHVNQLQLSIPESGLVTATFSLIGMGRTKSTTLPGGTVTAASDNPKISSVSIGDILIDGALVAGACITQVDFTWNNNAQTQRCLGKGLEIGAILETVAQGSGSFTVAWSQNTSAIYEKQFVNTPISLSIPMVDSNGNKYTLNLPKVLVSAPLPSGANSDILTTQFSYTVADVPPTLTRAPVATGGN